MRRYIRSNRAIAIVAAAVAGFGISTQGFAAVQSTESIRTAAQRFLELDLERQPGSTLEVKVGHVDRRLRMPACGRDLDAFVPPGGRRKGRVTVGVRCEGVKPWKVFVNAEVRLYERIVVAGRTVARGEVLDTRDLRLARRDVARLQPGYYTAVEAVAGKHLTRGITHGTVLTQRMVRTPASVHRGQHVVLLARSGGLEVRMDGKALSDGHIGDVIRVRNRRSKRIVEGVVSASGVVNVPL